MVKKLTGLPVLRIGAAFANVSVAISVQTQSKSLNQPSWDGVKLRWLGQPHPTKFVMTKILILRLYFPIFYLFTGIAPTSTTATRTCLVDQKTKVVGSTMLRLKHEICYPDSGQNDAKIQRHFSQNQ